MIRRAKIYFWYWCGAFLHWILCLRHGNEAWFEFWYEPSNYCFQVSCDLDDDEILWKTVPKEDQ